MLAYAANRRVIAERRSSPNAMLVIIAAHIAAVAVLMSAKMDVQQLMKDPPIKIDLIREDEPPPPVEIREVPTRPQPSIVDRPKPLIPTPPIDSPLVDSTPTPMPSFDQIIGPKIDPQPKVDPTPAPPVNVAARLLTPAAELKPPYPSSKLASGEEAVLRLRLTIDERGRVIAVEPVGPADRTFLEAARRHLLARWRYRPATEDGRAVESSAVITLRFRLEG